MAQETKNELTFRALDSYLRRELLSIAREGPMSSQKYFDEVTRRGLGIKYKESVYKELQLLVDSGLMDKQYDKRSKTIVYSPTTEGIAFDTDKMEVGPLGDDKIHDSKSVDEDVAVKVLRALNSPLRRTLLRRGLEGPLSSVEYNDLLSQDGFGPKLKESTYKGLETLADLDLMKKYYDKGSKRIVYKSNVKKIFVDLSGASLAVQLELIDPIC